MTLANRAATPIGAGSSPSAPSAPAPSGVDLATGRLARLTIAAVRIAVGILWVQNVNWKHPPDFGRSTGSGLYEYTLDAVTHPVLAPFAWAVKNIVLPHFVLFGFVTLGVEFLLGALLIAGVATRLVAGVALLQTLAITFSALYGPGEWQWSYYLMIAAHLVLFAVGAGRVAGIDALFRPSWQRWNSRLGRFLVRAS